MDLDPDSAKKSEKAPNIRTRIRNTAKCVLFPSKSKSDSVLLSRSQSEAGHFDFIRSRFEDRLHFR